MMELYRCWNVVYASVDDIYIGTYCFDRRQGTSFHFFFKNCSPLLYRYLPLNSKIDNQNSQIIQSPVTITLLFLLCYSANQNWNLPYLILPQLERILLAYLVLLFPKNAGGVYLWFWSMVSICFVLSTDQDFRIPPKRCSTRNVKRKEEHTVVFLWWLCQKFWLGSSDATPLANVTIPKPGKPETRIQPTKNTRKNKKVILWVTLCTNTFNSKLNFIRSTVETTSSISPHAKFKISPEFICWN